MDEIAYGSIAVFALGHRLLVIINILFGILFDIGYSKSYHYKKHHVGVGYE